ncbi:acyltransferase family protein [Planctomicrobium piriforme]|uniref:Peptidoglycan/LPS O-acetylase OafA/YrhL, contains acyltransferase and SGNH-hydrolase domains n=1 Tax=Planctomicrobium piriforme TaxID=1576369 RepID=A0A1I3SVE4_9PLAN|nr:acyltransferase [Planctomicrobium piriforme]SFJ62814.1 Peptidoglycan/LPS O-acetylase OafA/YrhL, contains acyltransferase and SGNH-hydrolase domains [Planctomicrobium piriforme]
MNRLRQLLRIPPPSAFVGELDLVRHRPALDGIRGLAVLLVLCYDCLKIDPNSDAVTLVVRRMAASGWIGVDLFFVLSGFLITGILLDTRGTRGYWKNFLARRAVRIFPLYYATLFTVFLWFPLVLGFTGASASTWNALDGVRADQAWYWVYLENWLFAWRGAWPEDGLLKHFWSLAVEEQFYLVWPLAVAMLSRRQLGWLCLSLCVVALSLRVCLLTHGAPPMVPHVMTITRMDSLCWGALMAIALRSSPWQHAVRAWAMPMAVTGVGMALAAEVLFGIFRSESFAAYSFGHTLTALAFASVMGAVAVSDDRAVLNRLLGNRVFITFGKYSYAIYVFHRFIYRGVLLLDWSALPNPVRGWVIFGVTAMCCLLAARISWVLLEAPCLKLKRYFPRSDERVTAAQSAQGLLQPSGSRG